MKIIKLTHQRTPALYEWIADKLPPSLRAAKRDDGYGTVYEVEVKARDCRSYFTRDGIATITDGCIELRYPEWFSDFENLIRAYEIMTGKEITFKFWES